MTGAGGRTGALGEDGGAGNLPQPALLAGTAARLFLHSSRLTSLAMAVSGSIDLPNPIALVQS